MTWTSLSFAFGSVLTSTKMTQLYDNITAHANGDSGSPQQQSAGIADNAVTAAKIASGAVGQDEIGASAVGQGELKTAFGDVTTGANIALLTLAGGEYGFYPLIRDSTGGLADIIASIGGGGLNAGNVSEFITATDLTTSFTTRIVLGRQSGGGPTVQARQRYFQASPPYESYRVGDQVPLFVFALVDKTTGDVVATYTAEDPPWANNGPTIINPLGIKQRLARQRAQAAVAAGATLEDAWIAAVAWMNEAANRSQIVAAMRAPIPQAEKNADMALIPHPFGSFDPAQHVVAVINPTDDRFNRGLHTRFNYGGDSIAEMLHAGAFIIDNTPMAGLQPPANVMAVSARLK